MLKQSLPLTIGPIPLRICWARREMEPTFEFWFTMSNSFENGQALLMICVPPHDFFPTSSEIPSVFQNFLAKPSVLLCFIWGIMNTYVIGRYHKVSGIPTWPAASKLSLRECSDCPEHSWQGRCACVSKSNCWNAPIPATAFSAPRAASEDLQLLVAMPGRDMGRVFPCPAAILAFTCFCNGQLGRAAPRPPSLDKTTPHLLQNNFAIGQVDQSLRAALSNNAAPWFPLDWILGVVCTSANVKRRFAHLNDHPSQTSTVGLFWLWHVHCITCATIDFSL